MQIFKKQLQILLAQLNVVRMNQSLTDLILEHLCSRLSSSDGLPAQMFWLWH